MLLPMEESERFVRGHLEKRERLLRLAGTEGSPLYVLEPAVLKERAGRFRQAFAERFADFRCYFAMKSNNHPRVAATVLEAGFGLDVSSGRELETALGLGAQEIIFTGPGKTGEELRLAVEHAPRITLLIDSFRELQRLEEAAAAQDTVIRAGVRLCTNPTGIWRKFGITLGDLPGFFAAAKACPHVDLQGLQFHTSWNLSPQAQTDFIALLGKTLADHPSIASRLRFLDLGGGYWPQPGEWFHAAPGEDDRAGQPPGTPPVHCHRPAVAIETFAAALGQAVSTHLGFLPPCRIFLEPGRWICNDAMHLLLRVVDRKAPDLVITDGGIHAIGWERFATDYFPILNLTQPSLRERPCMVCGSLCTPDDLFGFSYFGEGIAIGDLLLIPCQGAYTYSLKQEFIKPTPRVVILGGEGNEGAG